MAHVERILMLRVSNRLKRGMVLNEWMELVEIRKLKETAQQTLVGWLLGGIT